MRRWRSGEEKVEWWECIWGLRFGLQVEEEKRECGQEPENRVL